MLVERYLGDEDAVHGWQIFSGQVKVMHCVQKEKAGGSVSLLDSRSKGRMQRLFINRPIFRATARQVQRFAKQAF